MVQKLNFLTGILLFAWFHTNEPVGPTWPCCALDLCVSSLPRVPAFGAFTAAFSITCPVTVTSPKCLCRPIKIPIEHKQLIPREARQVPSAPVAGSHAGKTGSCGDKVWLSAPGGHAGAPSGGRWRDFPSFLPSVGASARLRHTRLLSDGQIEFSAEPK